tara:strand:+ start:5608 stop:5826 length:219 start_codon:yes stop_codon:yes gene_type:complete
MPNKKAKKVAKKVAKKTAKVLKGEVTYAGDKPRASSQGYKFESGETVLIPDGQVGRKHVINNFKQDSRFKVK